MSVTLIITGSFLEVSLQQKIIEVIFFKEWAEDKDFKYRVWHMLSPFALGIKCYGFRKKKKRSLEKVLGIERRKYWYRM